MYGNDALNHRTANLSLRFCYNSSVILTNFLTNCGFSWAFYNHYSAEQEASWYLTKPHSRIAIISHL
jgi:hypothetical protein